MIMKVMVLGGAGAVASETTRDLVFNSTFEEIIIADTNLAGAEKLAEQLREYSIKKIIPQNYLCPANQENFHEKAISTLKLDASRVDCLVPAFKEVDVVACGLPFEYDLQVTEAAVRAGVNALDLSFAAEQMDFDAQAKKKDITYIPGVGATPGTTNVMARQGVERLDRAEEVHIYFAAFRCLAPAPGLLQTTLWEFDPENDERVYYENGRLISAEPFSGKKLVDFHSLIGRQEVVYIPHPETVTVSKSFPQLKRVSVRGCFTAPVMRLMKALLESGFLSHREIDFYGKKVTPIQVTHDFLLKLPESEESGSWAYGLVVEVKGVEKGKQVTYRYANTHPGPGVWGNKAAYYKNVGIPLAVGAEMLARGQVEKKGVAAPELALDPSVFFSQLSRRGIQIKGARHLTY